MDKFDDLSKRDNWRARAALYSNGMKIASQKCEDLVARRILVGLGYHEKGINKLEASLELAYDPEKPLFDRVKTILEVVGGDFFSPDPGLGRYSIQCRNLDKTHKPILDSLPEFVELAESRKDGAVIAGRVGDERIAWGYVVLRREDAPPWLLRPPAVLIGELDNHWVWYRELSDLIHDMAYFNRWNVPGSVDFDQDTL